MALTDAKIKATKLEGGKKVQTFADSFGLYLFINKSGKYWRLKHRYDGKEKSLPLVSTLKQARDARQAAKEQIKAGVDPSQAKQPPLRVWLMNGLKSKPHHGQHPPTKAPWHG
ncbi:MAG: DUF4102 domain-containing protein [Flavobacteriales bacterium]|nr:DUF4102 domain-containing protein [Flavobacteriales bacterium]